MNFFMKYVFSLTAVLLLSACNTTNSQIKYQSNTNKPTVNKNSLYDMQQCFISKMRNPKLTNAAVGYVINVENVADGTVPLNSSQNGALADAGKLQMIKSLFALLIRPNTDANHTILTNRVPLIFRQDLQPVELGLIDRDLLLFGYDVPKKNQDSNNELAHYVANYNEGILKIFNDSRKQNGSVYSKKEIVRVFVINAAFSRYDTDGLLNGYGSDTQYDKNTEIKLTFGKKKIDRYMGLTVNIIDPTTNLVLAAENFELALSQNDNTTSIKVGRKDFIGSGLTINQQTINSPHEAQQILIDYAAMWFVKKLFSANDFSSCGNI